MSDLLCTTEDKVADMRQYEPTSFSRCCFAPRTFLAETEEGDEDDDPEEIQARHQAIEDRKVRREERRMKQKAAFQKRNAELERAYRSQKSFELWRFRCIHGDGCTIFPLWKDASREIIKSMFTSGCGEMSGGSMTNVGGALIAPTTEAPMITSNSEASHVYASATEITQNDEELARSLAVAAEAIDDETPLGKRRRTTRRAVTASDGKQAFYGGQISLSQDALFDPIVRLLQQANTAALGGGSSLMDLRRILFPENYDSSRGGLVEMKKLRLALGNLVYKLGKVGRLIVNVKVSDAICWDILRDSGP